MNDTRQLRLYAVASTAYVLLAQLSAYATTMHT